MRIRKNAVRLPRAERLRYVTAVKALKANVFNVGGTRFSQYDQFVALHLGVIRRYLNQNLIGNGSGGHDGAHNTPAFLPWHRKYLWELEEQLRTVDSGVTDQTSSITVLPGSRSIRAWS